MTDEKKLEILYDHYKDTFGIQKESLRKRNGYTLICLGLIAALSFQISNPDQSNNISNELIKKNIGDFKIDFSYISNVLTFTLLWIVIMYYQINLHIEKIYRYLQDIELKLTKEIAPFEITREGKTYLDHYPWLSVVVHKIYSVGFPVTLTCVSIIKWRSEKNQFIEPFKNGHFWVDTIFLFGILLTSVLYLANRQFNDFNKKK
jgi:hypothetical protein